MPHSNSEFIDTRLQSQFLFFFQQEISEGLFPHIAKPRQNYDKKREENGRPPPAPWAPLFRLQLNRLEVRAGCLHSTCLAFTPTYGHIQY